MYNSSADESRPELIVDANGMEEMEGTATIVAVG